MTIRTSTPSRAVVLLIAAAIVFFLLLPSGVGAGNEVHPTGVHLIQSGETLWTIASRHTPEGGDVRTTVSSIKSLNRMQGSTIQAGARLIVPLLPPGR